MFRKKINLEAFQVCTEKLYSRGLTLAFAESMTGGYLSAVFSQGIYASSYFKGAVVATDKSVQIDLLQVNPATMEQYTAESIASSTAMIEGLKNLIDADIYVGITGLAIHGESENKYKPVGSVFITVLYGDILFTKTHRFKGDRTDINIATLNLVISALLLMLEEPYLKE